MVSKLQSHPIESIPHPLSYLGRESRLSPAEPFEERERPRGRARAVAPQGHASGGGGGSSDNLRELAWIARALAASRPARHIDISPTPALAAIAGAFVRTDWYACGADPDEMPGARSVATDRFQLPFLDASVPSLSCGGVLEHLGLPRGGENGDLSADRKAMAELKRVLGPDGSLLLVCPVGRPRASGSHRIYSFGQVLDGFEGLELEEFALVPDSHMVCGLLMNPDPRIIEKQTHGSGCFWFRKPPALRT